MGKKEIKEDLATAIVDADQDRTGGTIKRKCR